MMKEFLQAIGYLLLGIAALAFGYIVFIIGHRFTVLERPVKIEEGYSFSQTFTVDRSETYALGVKCQKTIPFDPLNDALIHDLAATFSIYDGTTLIDDDTNPHQLGGSWSAHEIFRGFGRFEAKPFHTYRVDVRFTRSLPILAAADPVVVIRIEASHASNAFVAFDILFIPTVVLAAAGVVCVRSSCSNSRERDKLVADLKLL